MTTQRNSQLNRSTAPTELFDVIVIGAGINGAGIARDAAKRGLKVCVLDKGDIGAGTSSWSTRLIHGGLRYLEHLEFGLVRESLRERETLLRIAPHLVKPLPILIPIYKGMRRSRREIRAGMVLYDLLSFDKTLPRHRKLSRDATLLKAPGIRSTALTSSVIYYDAQVQFAERLVLENILDAQRSGAEVLTYAEVVRIVSKNDQTNGVEFIHHGQRSFVRGRLVINAAGPWVDRLLGIMGDSKRLIGGTKGSHIIVAQFAGAPQVALYSEAQADGRPFFILPWNGQYLIGTTDIHFNDDPDQARCDSGELEYLLNETNYLIPQAKLSHDQILFTYSGVRPLPFTDSDQEGKITRRHFIEEHPRLGNVFSLVGGKLTTYRNLAEQSVDLTFHKLNKNLSVCRTADVPLPGATSLDATASDIHGSRLFDRAITERLLGIYGSRTGELIQICNQDPDLLRTLRSCGQTLKGEIVFAFECEMAHTLADCLLRRTMIGLREGLGAGIDVEAAAIGRRFLGWTEIRAKEEIAHYRKYIERFKVP